MTPRPLWFVARPDPFPGRAGRWLRAAVLGAGMGAALVACSRSVEDRVAEAQSLLDAGEAGEAITTLREVLDVDPESTEANRLLGAALLQTGQPSAAVFPLQKAVDRELERKETGASILLANAFLQIQSYDDAIHALDRALEVAPDQTMALRMRAEARLRANQPAEAIADAQRLVELSPDDFGSAVLNASALTAAGRIDDAEKEYSRLQQLGTQSGDPSLAARGCLAMAKFQFEQARAARAQQEFERCSEAYPTDSLALQLTSEFFERTGQPSRAVALWKRAVEQAPENLGYRLALAQRLRRGGEEASALSLLQEAANSFGVPSAWQALAEFQRGGGDLAGAEQSLTKAIEASGGASSAPLQFALADLYVDLGQLDRAEAEAEKLEDPAHRSLIHGRVLLAQGDAPGALAAFDTSVRRWPNNARARFLAGIAARQAGDVGRAEQELREALRADPRGTDAALALAQVALQFGSSAQAAALAQSFLDTREGHRAEALRVRARALAANKDVEGARAALAELAKIPGERATAVTERAFLEAQANGPRAAVQVIEESRIDLTDPANEAMLRALAENLVVDGQGAKALARVEEALKAHPDVAPLHELHGAVLGRMGRAEEARAAYQSALSLDPNSGNALAGLGALALSASDLPGALGFFDRAMKLLPADMGPAYSAAQIVLAQGNVEEAIGRLREIVRRDASHTPSRNDLAFLLASKGQELDLALALADQAQRMSPRPDYADTVGWVRLQRGELDAAITAFEEAVAGKPKDPTIRYHLGLALARKGERARALTVLREALSAGAFPEAEAARQELARLEGQ